MVCHPVHRHRWARRAWSIRSFVTGDPAVAVPRPSRSGARAASRMTIPGVQKPHWLPPVATRASDHRSRSGSGQAVEGGHLAARQAAGRGHTGHPGRTVDPDRAAAALPLGAAAVLDRADAQLVAEDVEQRRPVVGHLDVGAVDAEVDQGIQVGDQLKEEPQPQVREALGLVTWNPAPCSPSL